MSALCRLIERSDEGLASTTSSITPFGVLDMISVKRLYPPAVKLLYRGECQKMVNSLVSVKRFHFFPKIKSSLPTEYRGKKMGFTRKKFVRALKRGNGGNP